MTPSNEHDAAIEAVKDEINGALDQVESAGFALTEITPPGRDSLTERLGRIVADLEQWKADAWEALDR